MSLNPPSSVASSPGAFPGFKSVFESLPEHALLLDIDDPRFTILAATHTVCAMVGRRQEDVVGNGVLDVFVTMHDHHDESNCTFLGDAFREVKNSKGARELHAVGCQMITPSGDFQKRFWDLRLTPVLDECRNVSCIIGLGTEVTERVRSVESFHDRIGQNLVKSILDASFNGIYALTAVRDADGTIVDFTYRFANQVTAGFLGMTPENVVGKRMSDLLPENRTNGFFEMFCKVVLTGETVQDQTYFEAGPIKHWFNYVVVPISEDTLVVTIQDVSEQKRDEEMLKNQKERLEISVSDLKIANDSLERFAYAASHDLQEPLRKVQIFSDLLLHHGETLDEKGRRYIQKIVSSVVRMKQLVSDVLQFSQHANTVRYDERVDLNELLSNIELELEFGLRQKLAVVERERLPVVPGNTAQLRQLFHNLYNNALKFSRPDRALRITISSSPIDFRSLHKQHGNPSSPEYVAIQFSDNGIGFGSQYAEKIFELFTRLHSSGQYEGSGIGLALCKRVAHNHGGDIKAYSAPGDGAVFEVILPA